MALAASVFVHPQALCESDDVGPRTRIWPFAQVMRGARVGADCNICGHAFIEKRPVPPPGPAPLSPAGLPPRPAPNRRLPLGSPVSGSL